MTIARALMRMLTPRPLRRKLVDALESVRRRFPGAPEGLPKYGLAATQMYPLGSNLFDVMKMATRQKLADLNLHSATPVSSIGTCFAEEFAFFMTEQGHNYVRTENEDAASSANWGRVYTIPNLRQIVRYSVDEAYPVIVEETRYGWFDPLREARGSMYSKDRHVAEEAIRAHRRASQRAFTDCRILIITVGQNEGWVDRSTGQVWAKRPPREILNPRRDDFSAREFGYAENVAALRETVEMLWSINATLKIVFTVSPVASQATFSDTDVVSRSFANKCLLRAVVHEVVASAPGKLYYFPSFEMILCDNPRNFRADNRHVKYSAVGRVFALLSGATALDKSVRVPPDAALDPAAERRAASLSSKH